VESPDVVIVGSGIAGGALATVLASAGIQVLTLERQPEFTDHVRGEILWPWGVRAARALDLERVFLEAGAQVVTVFDIYDELTPEPVRMEVGEAVPGIDGSLNIRHPQACTALTEAALATGADVRQGVGDIQLTTGKRQHLRWTESGRDRETRCQLIVAADGRRSSLRSQVGIGLEIDPPAHLIAGMLVESVDGMDEGINVMAREADLIFYSFPQQCGQSRLYFCFPTDQRSRFAGPDGPKRFLDTCALECLQNVAEWSGARQAGPCATFPGEDSRAASLIAEGLVLIGDAAGYENPLQGQGLSMALQDALELSEALLGDDPPNVDLTGYAERRVVRKRLADIGTALEVWTNEGCVVQEPEERAARNEFIERDEVLSALQVCFMTGFDSLPQDLTHADLADRLANYG
jgi:2-polyprenyl-6-methoxyphenol hydroxylase-like FAD-dependent oxidoreductase